MGTRIAVLWLLGLLCLAPAHGSVAAPPPGTFVMVVSDNPDNLNPYLHSLAASSAVYGFTFDSLYTVNYKGDWIPALATAESISPEGLVWAFKLRPGVRWSDGAAFDAADVKFTWRLATNKEAHITYATGFDRIASIDTPDPLTVVFHLREPYAPFRDQVVGSPVVPRHKLERLSLIHI